MVEAVPLDSGELMFVLLDDLLQSTVQILLLLLKKLLFLDGRRTEIRHDMRKTGPVDHLQMYKHTQRIRESPNLRQQ